MSTLFFQLYCCLIMLFDLRIKLTYYFCNLCLLIFLFLFGITFTAICLDATLVSNLKKSSPNLKAIRSQPDLQQVLYQANFTQAMAVITFAQENTCCRLLTLPGILMPPLFEKVKATA